MKQIVIILAFVILSMTSVSSQQFTPLDDNIKITADSTSSLYPYGLTYKALILDYQSQNGGSITNFSDYHYGFEIGISKSITDNFNLYLPVKAGVVNRSEERENLSNCVHRNVFGADLQAQYLFRNPEKVSQQVIPYVFAGAGGVIEDEGEFNVQIPFGGGLNFRVKDNVYINWQSEYRFSLSENRNNLQHGLGFTYLFGAPAPADIIPMEKEEMKIDSDGDGLEDDIDLCPQVAGPLSLKGCPDKDEDGIPDYRDDCPSIPGVGVFKGCPDTDGDGISDNDDDCPNKAGTKSNNGCPEETPPVVAPDSDGDGIPDASDKCPTVKGDGPDGCPVNRIQERDGDGVADNVDKCPDRAGIAAFGGCPDSDGDGIDDSRDKCPNSPGTVASGGCPEISRDDRDVLEVAMRAVTFDTGKATLKSESYSVLNQIGQLLLRYPDYNLIIEGHTDNVGSSVNNQLLSERRARACYEYLRDKSGVPASRMTHTGYGESRPISSNDNLEGRKLNRRVVFNLVPR